MDILYYILIPVVTCYALNFAWEKISVYGASLWVEGKADEFVLILNNGQLKQAGIGLRCFKGHFDQVAKFPAKMNQVSFESEQVTTEMQGVKVTGNLFWRIDEREDGPFKAYTNLGADISSDNPKTANSNLQQQASAIVRD
jgi:hypothetical protein